MCVGLFLCPLDCLPLFEHGAGIARVAGSEHMRMPPDQFVRRFANDFADVEAPSLPGDLRMHDYQQEQIAKFLSKMRIVFRARSLRHFVSFFN